ncbi:MAG: acetate--CoA ligase family protein [Cryomorphaceae bacterium]|nr:acetate--CoA ligase family protein [Cryomorphaceae bacterium]
MLNPKIFSPDSIAVIGASENPVKPGGKVLKNLLDGGFPGEIYAVNPKPIDINGVGYFSSVDDLPLVDLAILAIPAKSCVAAIKALANMGVSGFIVFSAGFSEAGDDGVQLENEMVRLVNQYGATLIGPNCVGVITKQYKGVFTTPVPDFDPKGCELISSSGATAVFIMEAARHTGLTFSNIFSIGNASQTGVEDLLEWMDITYDPENSSKVKLLYLENIKHPFRFMKHAASLIQKGCKIAAIKSGYSEAGSRAASSHTGAMATSDGIIRAMFKKCGVAYCSSREELINVACVWQNKALKGKNIAIITHAGGSAVMLTDALTTSGLSVPTISEEKGSKLLPMLHPGSSVANPIDFLATGTAEQLGLIIDFCEALDEIDGMAVVFGSPGLFRVGKVYDVLHEKMEICEKPIFPVLPSLVNAAEEIEHFVSKGHVHFSDEVVLGRALGNAHAVPPPTFGMSHIVGDIDLNTVRHVVKSNEQGYLSAEATRAMLEASGIKTARQSLFTTRESLSNCNIPFPVVMKVEGVVHKTDVGGVSLNVSSNELLHCEFDRLMKIPGAKGVLIQEMIKGHELYCGAIRNANFGHLIVCGLGGIFVEILQDTASGIAPLDKADVERMIRSLRGYPIIQGYRGRHGVLESAFVDAVVRVSSLVCVAPEIEELDINPFMGNEEQLVAVDARIRIG